LDAAAAGTYSGQVSFGTNDPDENPFNFTLSGTVGNVPRIIDNGDPGFSAVGEWTDYRYEGYQGDMHYSWLGSGGDVATWSFSGLTPGQYRVSASWTIHANRATDAPFTVLDGSTPLGTVRVNQELAPNDFSDAGTTWENLGVFTISGNTLVVRLSDNANEYVIADAIRIERVGDLPTAGLLSGVALMSQPAPVESETDLALLEMAMPQTHRQPAQQQSIPEADLWSAMGEPSTLMLKTSHESNLAIDAVDRLFAADFALELLD
jgi:hypothetical protein